MEAHKSGMAEYLFDKHTLGDGGKRAKTYADLLEPQGRLDLSPRQCMHVGVAFTFSIICTKTST